MIKREKDILAAAEVMVKEKLDGESSGHDWWHIVRVRNSARAIAEQEKADVFICELAALLHDVADEKLVEDPEQERYELAQWLYGQPFEIDRADHILTIIDTMSFKGGNGQPMTSLEGKIVQDADRLDAIGAIGIARTMAYSGNHNRPIHDPNMKPREQMTLKEYRSGKDTTIMHFYEKLLKLKDLMNTDYGKKMAEQRHQFLEFYLAEFYAEWQGKK